MSPGSPFLIFQVLFALTTILVATKITGRALRYLHQPMVVGEMVGGILLGPSFLGLFLPQVHALLIPVSTMPAINVIAQLGIVLFMFTVGLGLDTKLLKSKGPSILAISQVSILFPFLLGSGLAYFYILSSRFKGLAI